MFSFFSAPSPKPVVSPTTAQRDLDAQIFARQQSWEQRLLPHRPLVMAVYHGLLLGLKPRLALGAVSCWLLFLFWLTRLSTSLLASCVLVYLAYCIVELTLHMGVWNRVDPSLQITQVCTYFDIFIS
jgi:hypothetical protein